MQCQCGEWSGDACQGEGRPSRMKRVRFVPDYLRGTAIAAGGDTFGPYAVSVLVTRECAEWMREYDPEWVRP